MQKFYEYVFKKRKKLKKKTISFEIFFNNIFKF